MTSAPEEHVEYEQYHRYCLAGDLCDALDVVDVASGEGYGAAMLARHARRVTGVEIDAKLVVHATANYQAENLRFVQGEAFALPLSDASADVVVSFNTLEHLADYHRFIIEVRRVLRPGGLFVVGTPDRKDYSGAGADPNPEHLLGLTKSLFQALLAASFAHFHVLSQRPVLGSVIEADESAAWRCYERRDVETIEATSGWARAHSLLGVATDGDLPDLASSVCLDHRRVHDVLVKARRLLSAEKHAQAMTRERDAAVAQRDAAVEQVEAERRRADAERDDAKRAREAAAVDVDQSRQAMNAVLYSTTWRLLAPIRAAGTRFPNLARVLRRIVKLVFWTVTLQVSARFADRRRYRAELARAVGTQSEALRIQELALLSDKARLHVAPQAGTAIVSKAFPPHKDMRGAFLTRYGTEPIHFPPVATPDVTVIIPVYQGLADLQSCLRSLAVHREREPLFEVIVIDDCSVEPVLWAIPDSGGLNKLANPESLGFLLTCNRAASMARGRVLCFLHSDTIVSPDWLRSLVNALDEVPAAAIAGGMMLNADGTIREAGWRILSDGEGYPLGRGSNARDGAHTYRRRVDCVTGGCLAIRRAHFEKIGGFDKLYAPALYEDFDLAFRLRRRGLHAIYEPRSQIVHFGSASRGATQRDVLSAINHRKFTQRFANILRKQPFDTSDRFALRHGSETGPVILVVQPGIPQPERQAGDVLVSRYLSLLLDAGWCVVFAPMDGRADGPVADWLERLGIELIRAPQTVESWLSENGSHVQRVWLSLPEIAEAVIGLIRAHTSATIAYYLRDSPHLRLRQEANVRGDYTVAADIDRARLRECAVFRAVDSVIAPSEEEGATIRRMVPTTRVTVLPPDVYDAAEIITHDHGHFAPLNEIVFLGGYPHSPDVDAALFIVSDIMPLVWQACPDACLVLVGCAHLPEICALAGPRVVVTGQVPPIESFLARARLVVAVVRFGVEVKDKVVNALRLGVPVVTTRVGAGGIGIEPGVDAIVAGDVARLAGDVIGLLRDPGRCAALSEAGAALIHRRFSRVAAQAALKMDVPAPCCTVCGSAKVVVPPDDNLREGIVCRCCLALGRTEVLARVVLANYAPKDTSSLTAWARQKPIVAVHQVGSVGSIAETLRGHPWFTCSGCFEDVPLGEAGPDGVRCENVTRITYADASFDLVISEDVMQHVADPVAGFAETARVLRPGGSHIFTIPKNRTSGWTVTQARLTMGTTRNMVGHLLPADYHADPAKGEEEIVCNELSPDLHDLLARAGLYLIEHKVPVWYGVGGSSLRVFEAIKQHSDGDGGGRAVWSNAVAIPDDKPPLFAHAAMVMAEAQDRYDIFETLIERCYTAELRFGATVVDGGANFGRHTGPMSRVVGRGGRVHAYEPLPFAAAELRRLFAGAPQVTVHENALAESGGVATFHHVVDDPARSSLLNRDLSFAYPGPQTEEMTVARTTLDQLAAEPVRFIKLDLEGYDYFALLGGRRLLKLQRPLIALECGRRDAAIPAGYGPDEFFGLFADVGYTVVDLFGRTFGRAEFNLPWNAREMPHYVVAIPSERQDVAPRLRATTSEIWESLK
jgi:FkbM family methyltransferase